MQNIQLSPVLGVCIGAIITSLLQSSSSVTLIIVSLVEARLLTLYQATAMIMGANIGTTITAQIIAFQPDKYIFIPFFVGIMFSFFKKRRKLRFLGEVLLGFSLIFIGMDILSKGLSPLQDLIRFQKILMEFGKTPILGIIMGFCSTAIIQSSSTGVAILQSLAMEGLIDPLSAISIIFGQNIGTCSTALLSSIPLSSAGKRAALIHLNFNLLGVIFLFPFIKIICQISIFLSPYNPARQIANAHSLFNIISTIIFIPFINIFVRVSEYLIRD